MHTPPDTQVAAPPPKYISSTGTHTSVHPGTLSLTHPSGGLLPAHRPGQLSQGTAGGECRRVAL